MKNYDKVCSIYKSTDETFFVSMWRLEMGIYMMGEVVGRIRSPVVFDQAIPILEKALALHRTGVSVPENAKNHADTLAVSLGFRSYKQMTSKCDMYLLESLGAVFFIVSQTKDNDGYTPDSTTKADKLSPELLASVLG